MNLIRIQNNTGFWFFVSLNCNLGQVTSFPSPKCRVDMMKRNDTCTNLIIMHQSIILINFGVGADSDSHFSSL